MKKPQLINKFSNKTSSSTTLTSKEIKDLLGKPKNTNAYWLGRWLTWQQKRQTSKSKTKITKP